MCEKALTENIRNIDFVEGLAENLPFEDETFDIVITRLAFHHFTNCEEPFNEMKRGLKKGGKLVIWDMVAAEDEFLNLYGKDFEMKLVERKEIPVNLTNWMELTDTPSDVRSEIVELMDKDLKKEMQTGFSPYLKDEQIYFNHRWLLLIGIKL